MNNMYENVTTDEAEGVREIDLRDLFRVLLSRALWIVLCFAICVAGAVIYTKAILKPEYKTTAVIYVNDGSMSSTGSVAIATYLAEDYAKTVRLRSVLEEAISNLGLNMNYAALASQIDVALDTESRIVEITLRDSTPARAQALCNEICFVSKDRFEKMTNVERVSIYEYAALPTAPSGPSLLKNVVLGGVIGLALPCIAILLWYVIDDRIKTAEDVQRALKISTLGNIPYWKE